MRCKRTSRTPRTRPSKRPRRTIPSASCAMSSSRTPRAAAVIAVASACGVTTRSPGTPRSRELPSKITLQLAPDDVVSVQTPGGGGTESPLRRPPDAVVLDVGLGKISPERARAVYGVVLDPMTHTLDAAATAAERARRA